jgi:ribosomal-protein-alanine N-acetyltransferase
LPCYIRMMDKGDIAQVAGIDREAFPGLWPPANYRREMENRLAHYIVACDAEKTVEEPRVEVTSGKGLSGLWSGVRRLFNDKRFFGEEMPSSSRDYIVGFAGFWIMAGEAHLTNIAVRESYRRQGIGELLLISVVDLAAELDTSIITLEVRASNTAAQNLYRKYGFVRVGLRRGYYLHEREDGVLMSTERVNSASFQEHFQQLKWAYASRWGTAVPQIVR